MNFRRTKIKKEKKWHLEVCIKHASMTNGWQAEELFVDDIEYEFRGEASSDKNRNLGCRYFRSLK